jgi:hypothetical protein
MRRLRDILFDASREPFSRLALALQSGRFDVADLLFHYVGRSWKSTSKGNLQDV